MSEKAMIYGLIAQAMSKIGAIGKDSTATNNSGKQMYKFRGIDAVYNALNPVMSELGLFICPEVLEQTREERKTTSGSTLIYSILKIKFTMYAPDGSNVSCVVIGEGMDSGDKASNKAMSVALKYACFELFMIPTEEMVDPDAEVHEVAPKQTQTAPVAATVQQVAKVPEAPKVKPILEYLAKEREALRVVREIDKASNAALFKIQTDELKKNGLVPNKPLDEFTQDEATLLIQLMYTRFDPMGKVLKDAGQTA